MNAIEGTDIGQASSVQVDGNFGPTKLATQPADTQVFAPVVGAQFAATNPPVNLEKALGSLSGGASAVNSCPAGPVVVREMMDALRQPRKAKLDLPVFGVLTIDNQDWSPRRFDDIPPSLTQGLGMELSAHFALIYNQSSMAVNKRRWALVTTRGTVLVLCGLQLADRPSNPAAFPAGFVQGGLTYDEAERFALEANEPRWQLSRIPRQWTIALRRADTVEKDGDA
jgi:hypothetical protein